MRSIWKGSVSFGLVNVPVKVYSATEDNDIKFHQVHAKDHGRIRYKRVCEICREVVEYRAIATSYAYEDGQTVIMVTHDPVAASAADRVVLLKDGQLAGELENPDPERVSAALAHLGASA